MLSTVEITNQYKASSSRIRSSEGGREYFNWFLTDADGHYSKLIGTVKDSLTMQIDLQFQPIFLVAEIWEYNCTILVHSIIQ